MIGDAPYPKAAPARWPYTEHRTMEQVMAEEARSPREVFLSIMAKDDARRRKRIEPIDYGSPYAVRRVA